MPDLFDFAAKPASVVKAAPQPEPKIEPICQPEPAEAASKPCSLPEPVADHCHLVASFSCYCGCQDEVLEPAPAAIPCWGCKRTMHRWHPKDPPPPVSARVWVD